MPGGVPLAWLAWAAGTEVAVVALTSRSLVLDLLFAVLAAVFGAGEGGGWRAAGVAASVAFAAALVVGVVLGVVDWPLRLVVLPIAVATFAGQITPDGRPAHRYLLSRVAVRLRPDRRSLDRSVRPEGSAEVWGWWVWIAPDHHHPNLGRGRVRGPAEVSFGEPVVVTARRGRGGRYVARPASARRRGGAGELADVVELGAGRVLEIRP